MQKTQYIGDSSRPLKHKGPLYLSPPHPSTGSVHRYKGFVVLYSFMKRQFLSYAALVVLFLGSFIACDIQAPFEECPAWR